MQVTLKNGTEVEIGEMSWGGWSYLKSQILDLLSDESSQGVLSVILGDIQSEGDISLNYKDLAPAIPRLIGLLMRALDSSTLYLADECCQTELETSLEKQKLKVSDVIKLRTAILEENDFAEFLKMEGNSLLAMIPKDHRESVEKTFSELAGAFNANQSLQEATAGPPM